jgi:hypothetical protein
MEPGWYPSPNGDVLVWFWDGRRWFDPVAEFERRITELIVPHLERQYREGFTAGVASSIEAAKRLLEV